MRVCSLGQEEFLEEEHGNPLQYSCLENPTVRGAWWATIHGIAEWDTTERAHILKSDSVPAWPAAVCVRVSLIEKKQGGCLSDFPPPQSPCHFCHLQNSTAPRSPTQRMSEVLPVVSAAQAYAG